MRALAVALLACAALAACGGSSSRPKPAESPAPRASVRELGSIDQLRTLFNASAGTPRLIVLASPT